MTLVKKIMRKFIVGDHVRLSKYKIIFAKSCLTNQSEKVKKVK